MCVRPCEGDDEHSLSSIVSTVLCNIHGNHSTEKQQCNTIALPDHLLATRYRNIFRDNTLSV